MADPAELVAVILSGAADPVVESSHLLHALTGGDRSSFPDELLEQLDRALPRGLVARAAAVESGARLAQRPLESASRAAWDLVVSAPPWLALDADIRYRTGGTLTRMILEAKQQVRLYAPYTTASGLALLAAPLLRATGRAVRVEITLPDPESDAAGLFSKLPDPLPVLIKTRTMLATAEKVWSHLKVMTVDGEMAYVGSANVSKRGLTGENVELGVLVRGKEVGAIDRLMDELTD